MEYTFGFTENGSYFTATIFADTLHDAEELAHDQLSEEVELINIKNYDTESKEQH